MAIQKYGLCLAFPGIYAFTAIHYTPAFFKKGKERLIALMRNNHRFQEVFEALGESENCQYYWFYIYREREEFTCYVV